MTEREHLNAVWRMTRRKPAGLNYPDMPEALRYIWHWFIAIANAGDVGLPEIEAYQRLMGVSMTPKEVELILDFDLTRRKIEHDQMVADIEQNNNDSAKPVAPKSKAPTPSKPRRAPRKRRAR